MTTRYAIAQGAADAETQQRDKALDALDGIQGANVHVSGVAIDGLIVFAFSCADAARARAVRQLKAAGYRYGVWHARNRSDNRRRGTLHGWH